MRFAVMVLVVVAGAPQPPGGIDGFLANFALVKAELQSRLVMGITSPETIEKLWRHETPAFEADPDYDAYGPHGWTPTEVTGRWAGDGTVEYYDFKTSDRIFEILKKKHGGQLPSPLKGHVRPSEAIYDGTTLAAHNIDDDQEYTFVDAWCDERPGFLIGGSGPFLWWMTPFPQQLKQYVPGVVPTVHQSERDGHPVEVETYVRRLEHVDGIYRIEISYDPTIGYLPRYVRFVSDVKGQPTQVNEMYLIEARQCAAGGFIPTEWYDTQFFVKDFDRRYPTYDDRTMITSSDYVRLGHFQTTSFKDRDEPVALTKLEQIKALATYGHAVKLRPGTRSLTMADVKSILGPALTNPKFAALPNLGAGHPAARSSPTPDLAELNELNRLNSEPEPTRSGMWKVAIGGLALILAAFFFMKRRRSAAFLVILSMAFLPGCAERSKPVVRLAGDFKQKEILYDGAAGAIPMTYVIRNQGNVPVTIRNADGGCTCRRIDKAKLPAVLKPDQSMEIPIDVTANGNVAAHAFNLTLQTDQGAHSLPATFVALATHQLNPPAFHASLQEGQKPWSFDLVHRSVFSGDKPPRAASLEVSPEFRLTKIDSRRQPVNVAPGLTFEDTTYRATLVRHETGSFKGSLKLRGHDGASIVEAPISWEYVPFLSTSPARVTLGQRPVRVFLRCPDEKVEFTEILSNPPGIKATISSTRELIISLDSPAPGPIQGEVKVGTSSPGRPPVKVPIVYYAASRSANRAVAGTSPHQ